jgi:high-affinity nickel-transport protein
MSLLALLLAGFLLGIRHAVDPDHVVAVSTIVTRFRSIGRAARVGALWGVGHTATILLVGGAIAMFRVTIPPRLGLGMELLVAAMLIVLGAVNLFGRHPSTDDAAFAPLRPIAIGFVHGLAGSAAVALLVLTAIGDPRWSVAYLLAFGMGTVAGMMLATAAMAVPIQVAAARIGGLQRNLRLASGAFSVGFGLFLVHQIGVVEGLFSGTPIWEPR